MANSIRTRFAPSPTGIMHLGNARTAIINYLVAKKLNGTFILRIEDTDAERNRPEFVDKIIKTLQWLGLSYQEGPNKANHNFGPYFQSERTDLYQNALNYLITSNLIYRCFCSKDRLDELHTGQAAAGLPPRYDRKCFGLSMDRITAKLAVNQPFIWRFLVNHKQKVVLNDLAKGQIEFDLAHFTDFSLTRPDQSFTFIFTNFVDDLLMKISHVIRGEDHLSNSANQLMLYHAFNTVAPIFWHMPMICNQEGKKLSKRDQHFNLDNLQEEGFLPEAIVNYLVSLGTSGGNELADLQALVHDLDLNRIPSANCVKYSEQQMLWINSKWIEKYEAKALLEQMLKMHPEAMSNQEKIELEKAIDVCKKGCSTLHELWQTIQFVRQAPAIEKQNYPQATNLNWPAIIDLLKQDESAELQVAQLKSYAKQNAINLKELFVPIRLACTGKEQGLGLIEIFSLLTTDEVIKRLEIWL